MFQRTALPLLRRLATPSISVPSSSSSRLFATSRLTAYSSEKKVADTTDPGYESTPESRQQAPPAKDAAPSRDSDPFPMPFDPRLDGLSLSSKHQLEHLTADPENVVPSRVPGREAGEESREIKIARMRYQIRHRGILETDLILSTFAKEHLDSMKDAELEEFDLVSDTV
jgi:hypothetical protein